jgi:hypothetical protein
VHATSPDQHLRSKVLQRAVLDEIGGLYWTRAGLSASVDPLAFGRNVDSLVRTPESLTELAAAPEREPGVRLDVIRAATYATSVLISAAREGRPDPSAIDPILEMLAEEHRDLARDGALRFAAEWLDSRPSAGPADGDRDRG